MLIRLLETFSVLKVVVNVSLSFEDSTVNVDTSLFITMLLRIHYTLDVLMAVSVLQYS